MKRVVFTGIGIIILAFFCVMLFLRLDRDAEVPVDISTQNADTEVPNFNLLKKPNVPKGWSEEEWEKKFNAELAKEAALETALEEQESYNHIESILADKRSKLSDADLAEIESMLSQFESLENMSESDIIDTLYSFFPEIYRNEDQRQLLLEFYRGHDEVWENKITKDQKLQFVVYNIQYLISNAREWEIERAEQMRISQELLISDPDLYFDLQAAEYADTIRELEESVREAEARGDTEMAETWRYHLSVVHEITKDQDYYRNVTTSIIKGRSEDILLLDHPDSHLHEQGREQAREWVNELVNELVEEMLDELPSNEFSADSDIAPAPSVSEKPSVSAPSVSDFEPLLKDVGEKYLDVVLSRYLSEKEFAKHYSPEYDKETLKSRTREMQKTLVSEIRKVMRNMNDVSETTKRERVKAFVMKNYDKEFAEAVLRQLNADDK